MSLPPAVLLGGGGIAVSAARSLAASGVRVVALGTRTDSVRRSRFCAEFVDLGADADARERWLEWLGDRAEDAVVLPCNDHALELVARHRAEIVAFGHRPVEANDDVVLAMLDKARTYELASRVGIPIPRSEVVSTPEEAEALGSELDFPCALKPLAAHRFALHFGAKLFVVERREELRAVLERARALDLEMMVTDIVPGPDHQHFSYYSYLDERGEPLFHFTKRKLRQYPTRFGLTCYQVTDWNPEVAELGLRFFQGIGLRGVGNVEFKRDARDGRLKLIECNHRFTAANDLVRRSGLDIPLLAYNRLTGRPGPSMDGYRTGVRMWHPIEDVRALGEYRRAGQLTARKWARSLLHRQHFPLVRADDPMPTVANLSRRVGGLARAARGGAPRAEGSGPAAPVVRPG